MATVYLAEDLKHDRKVAIKVLRPELAAVLGAERFVQEIKTTAQLQHPHILPLHDSGTADGFLFYVMPYIEGETLRDKLDRETQLGVDEAVRVAREVADALDYAHRHGVIHRDIKPENILLHDGRPMVADFGIALAVSAAAGGRLTETGTSIGTPHYMAPEQATGDKQITGRADLYSLASVLYEMLTGEPPHSGGSAQAVIMKIIAEPVKPVEALRKSVPPNVAAAVMIALEKLPADRFEGAMAFADALADPGFARATLGPGAPAYADLSAIRLWVRSPWSWVALAAVLGLAAALLMSRENGGTRTPDGPVLAVVARDSIPPWVLPWIEVAVDGAVAWGDSGGIVVRPPGALEASVIAEEASTGLSFSPDGGRIVFLDGSTGFGGRTLRTVSVNGGPATSLVSGADLLSAPVWGGDGWIYYGAPEAGELRRVPEGGGDVQVLLDVPASQIWPTAVLPGGRALLYTSATGSAARIMLLDMERRDTTELLADAEQARWIPTGHLVYVVPVVEGSGSLRVVPFDLERLQLTGPSAPVREDVYDFGVNPGGTLAYLLGAVPHDWTFSLMDEVGHREALPIAPSDHFDIAISPDGRLAAYTRDDDIWIFDLDRGGSFALTEGRTGLHNPVWSPDGARIVYQASAGSMVRPIDRSAEPQPLPGTAFDGPEQWLEDGTILMTREGSDITATRLEGPSPRMLLEAAWREMYPAVSPDGRWMAYLSDRGGSLQLYVRSWPELTGETQVSTGEAPLTRDGFPQWSSDSRTLYYLDNERIVAADLRTAPGFVVEKRRTLPVPLKAGVILRGVHPDGRLLIAEPGEVRPGQIIVVANWFTELRNQLGEEPAPGR